MFIIEPFTICTSTVTVFVIIFGMLWNLGFSLILVIDLGHYNLQCLNCVTSSFSSRIHLNASVGIPVLAILVFLIVAQVNGFRPNLTYTKWQELNTEALTTCNVSKLFMENELKYIRDTYYWIKKLGLWKNLLVCSYVYVSFLNFQYAI